MEKVMECLDCGYKADKALWIGKAHLIDGDKVDILGIVGFDGDTECLDLDPLMVGFSDKVEGCEGETYCPSCKSSMYY